MIDRYRPLGAFAIAFAAEYKGFMKANDINNLQIAAKLGRNDGYVSERANGKRPLDTEDVDALAILTGWTGKDLMLELARRTRIRMTPQATDDVPTSRKDVALAAYDEPDWQERQEQENE